MGIDINYYAVYGVRHQGYDADFVDQAYRNVGFDHKNAVVDVIADSMSGSYIFVGKILFDGGNLRYGDYEDTLAAIDVENLAKYKEEAITGFKNWMPPEYHKWLEGEWKLYVFAHFS